MTLQIYSERALSHFRDMIRRVLDATQKGILQLPPHVDEGPDAETETTLKRLAENLSLAGDQFG
jgi:hypothetical protein